jgi:hypothetical protein
MIIRKSLLALALAASCALAALPSTILFQGNMVLDGKPVSGSKEMVVSLYDALTAGTEVWTKTYTAMFNNGYYAVELDNLAAVDFSKPLFVGLKIGTETVATRIPLTSAPYAKRAAVADSAVKAGNATYATTAGTANGLQGVTLINLEGGRAIVKADTLINSQTYAGYMEITNTATPAVGLVVDHPGKQSPTGIAVTYQGLNIWSKGNASLSMDDYGVQLVSGTTACTAAEVERIVYSTWGDGGNAGLFVCRDSDGSATYKWYRL